MSEIVQAKTQPMELTAHGFMPQNSEQVFRLAKLLIASGMLPSGWPRTMEGVSVGIMAGAEAGLNFTQTIKGIMVVNNKPTIWGDVALALCRRADVCESIVEWMTDNMTVAHCKCVRKGEPVPVERQYSIEDAKVAGLWGKAGPWKSYPLRMLQMRARAFAIRDAFPDCLNGLDITEEVMDYAPEAVNEGKPTAQSKIDALPELPGDDTTHQQAQTTTDPATDAPGEQPPAAGTVGSVADDIDMPDMMFATTKGAKK